ncbi:hypothetical protein ACUUL3_04775 [Thiovibrio sp. JS02]
MKRLSIVIGLSLLMLLGAVSRSHAETCFAGSAVWYATNDAGTGGKNVDYQELTINPDTGYITVGPTLWYFVPEGGVYYLHTFKTWHWVEGAPGYWTQVDSRVSVTPGPLFPGLQNTFLHSTGFTQATVNKLPSEYAPNGCSDLPPPPDPCDGLEPDKDTDGDGICDRCDYAPQDAQYGGTLYALMSTYNSDTGAHINSTCTAFPADVFGAMDSVTQSVYTNDIGRPRAEGEPVKIQSGFHEPIAYMTPCVCDKPCQPLFKEPENYSDNPDPIAGTDPVPTGETPTTVPQPTQADLNPGTIDPNGEHGTTTKDTGDPVADNTGIIGDILDSELNELNAGMRKTTGELNELNTKLDQGFEMKLDSSSLPTNSYDSSVTQPAESDLSSTLGNFIAAGLPYSDVIQATRAEVADSDPVIRYNYKGQEIIIGDFTDYQFILQIMGAAVVAASLLLSFFIVVGKS